MQKRRFCQESVRFQRDTKWELLNLTFHDTSEGCYRQIYFETIDLSIASITNRFDQPGFKMCSGMEQLLFKACKREDCEE